MSYFEKDTTWLYRCRHDKLYIDLVIENPIGEGDLICQMKTCQKKKCQSYLCYFMQRP